MSSSEKPQPRTPFKSSTSASAPTPAFLQQRDALLGEISIVGNEFGAVEALWSQFENVMAKEPGEGDVGKEEGLEGEDQESDKEVVEGATEDAKEVEGRK
ncbi:MAG: hypothetical protein Q9212_002369 [Teloschistes hypoglaucus]